MDLGNFGVRGRTMLWSQTCTIQRASGDASLYGATTNVHKHLKCSRVYEIPEEEKEKGHLTTVSRPLRIYTAVPSSGEIKEQDIVVVNSTNYFVVKATRWPHSDPTYYELVVDHRRGQ